MHQQLITWRLMAVLLLSAVGAIATADYNMPLVERQLPAASLSSSPLVETSVPPIFTTTSSTFSSFTPIVTLTGTSSSVPTASLSLTSSVPTSSSIPPTSTSISSTSIITTSASLITTSSIAPSTSISYVYSSSATPSQTAQPQNSGSSMSPNTTKIIIIVVCTVGGVLAIAAIGFVWRRFGRRRKDYGWDEDDFFGSPPPPPQHMSYQQPMGQQYNYQQHEDPFKRTLDQYHRSS